MSLFPKRYPRQISKKEFYHLGGFSNPNLYRKQRRNGGWVYYSI